MNAIRWHGSIIRLVLFAVAMWPAASSSSRAAAVRLALIPADRVLAPVVDGLTVELSKQPGLELLERAEIDKVYREQALAAGAKDFLKLGQILGADGVLILEQTREGETQVLSVRLAAVKPGVVLRQRSYPWPLENLLDWAAVAAGQFQPLLPKLSVLPKDALPISVLNIRSAIRSSRTEASERELTLLVQNRLTQVREVFLLERRRLGWLAEEKELKPAVEAPFWNGSYLLEGVVDRQGFSETLLTVNARLVPPGGGTVTELEVSGPRTNALAVAEALVRKILDGLSRSNSVPEWKPADEATKYLEEAKWALRWRMFQEAQAASDSAWALGRHDKEAALVRVKSYTAVVPPDTGGYQRGEIHNSTGRPELTARGIRELIASHPRGLAYGQRGGSTYYAHVTKMPDPRAIDRALYALSLYYSFARTLPVDEPVLNSPWFQLGLESLEAASQVLAHFHIVPDTQPPVANQLAELRALARDIAAWLSQSPSVYRTYWTERPINEGLRLDLSENIFRLQLEWGSFWHDRPAEAIAAYRELMKSAAFAQLRHFLWARPAERPRLAAWNAAERRSLPAVWRQFLNELRSSTNIFLQLEGKYLELAEASDLKQAEPAMEDLFTFIFSHRDEISANATRLLALDWHLGELLTSFDGWGEPPEREKLRRRYNAEYRPKLVAMRETTAPTAPAITGPNAPQSRRPTPPPAANINQTPGQPKLSPSIATTNVLLASHFEKLPLERLTNAAPVPLLLSGFFISAHLWREGRLWLDCRFELNTLNRGNPGNHAVIMTWTPPSGAWEIIPYPGDRKDPSRPPAGFMGEPETEVHFEVCNGTIYLSQWEEMWKCDLKTRRWEPLKFPGQSLALLFAWNQRVYAANQDSIFEILDGGQNTRVLASTRRRPPTSTLDSLPTLGRPTLFPGPDNTLRAMLGIKVHAWDGQDWHEMTSLTAGRAQVFDEATLLRPLGGGRDVVSLLAHNGRTPERWWPKARNPESEATVRPPRFPPGGPPPPGASRDNRGPAGPSFISAPAATTGSNIYFLVEHSTYTNLPTGLALMEKDGRHANLVCLERDAPKPITIPVRFALNRGSWQAWHPQIKSTPFGHRPVSWLVFTSEHLLIGQVGTPGIWLLPRTEIDALGRELGP